MDLYKSMEQNLKIIAGNIYTSSSTTIPSGYYTLNTTDKTITLSSPYNILTIENIIFIKNITKNIIIYNSTAINTNSITMDNNIITYISTITMNNADKLLISISNCILDGGTP